MDITRIGNGGVHTIEGNIAGSRAAQLEKERNEQTIKYQLKRKEIESISNINHISVSSISSSSSSSSSSKFITSNSSRLYNQEHNSVGLVSIDEFRKERLQNNNEINNNRSLDQLKKFQLEKDIIMKTRQEDRAKRRKKTEASLSFAFDDDDDDDDDDYNSVKNDNNSNIIKKISQKRDINDKKMTKNPNVNTEFLPDKEREENLEKQKEKLKREWLQEQEIIKKNLLEIVYSYWDGSGHRKSIKLPKGTTIGTFLHKVRLALLDQNQFKELKSITSDQLMYIKEDLIIPHEYSFYDLIITKARGKSGPLFHFDVHDDVRITHDVRVEKDESHPGKVVLRSWYERNKHIFPASRWEIYDPKKERGKYTIHGT